MTFFSPNSDGGLRNIMILNAAGLEKAPSVYIYACSHFDIDGQRSSVTALRQIDFDSGAETFQETIAKAIRDGVVGQIAAILTSDLVAGNARKQIEAAFPCMASADGQA
jgi:hypothetical protein